MNSVFRLVLRTVAVVCVLALWCVQPAVAGGERASVGGPNIVFILADDVGLGDVGCTGGKFRTPHIDALAHGGMRFEYCFATPLCGPSRCQCLTGRYPFRTGLINNHVPEAIQPQNEIMMPTVLKQAGYVTAQVGKWGQMSHGPHVWGFDEYLVFEGNGVYWREQSPTYRQNGEVKELPEGVYLPDLMHEFVVDFMTRHRDEPFYVYYAMSHIHKPMVPTPDSAPGSKFVYRENIEYMDKLVGELVSAVEQLGLSERTIIVFTGDNGSDRLPEHTPVFGRPISGHKNTMLEGGSRVPLIVKWPGVAPAGQVCHDLTDFSDFFPTLAELAGAALPRDVVIDGRSFAPQIKGQVGTPREWVYVELDGQRYVRDRHWKLTGTGELLDMRDAPYEEIPVSVDTRDVKAIAARRRLYQQLEGLVGPSVLNGQR